MRFVRGNWRKLLHRRETKVCACLYKGCGAIWSRPYLNRIYLIGSYLCAARVWLTANAPVPVSERTPNHFFKLLSKVVHWDVVCQGKDRGGLGLRKARTMNMALIAKLGWKLVSGSLTPWCRAFRLKYLSRTDFWAAQRRTSYSSTWKVILDVHPLFKKEVRWQPGFQSNLSW